MRRHVALDVFAGDFSATGRPLLTLDEVAEIARRARQHVLFPQAFADPRHLAVGLGFRVSRGVVHDCGGEVTDGRRIVYRWHPCPRERGLRVYHGLAHALLVLQREPHAESDAWVLTGELACPARLLRNADIESVALLQRHAPPWFVVAWARLSAHEEGGHAAE